MTRPLENLFEVSIPLADDAATADLGRALGAQLIGLGRGIKIYLSGNLGAGKTAMARAILRALGVTGRVKSPTFTLMEPYVAEIPMDLDLRENLRIYCYHFDFYRFADPREWLEAGFREYFTDDSLCIVEWPENAEASGHLPQPDLHIYLSPDGVGRLARLCAFSPAGAQCLSAVSSFSARLAPP